MFFVIGHWSLIVGLTRLLLVACFLLLVATGCANSQAPSGGPADKVPPKVIRTVPPTKSINVHPNEVEIEFSKFVTKPQVAQNLIVTPALKTELSWSFGGKTLYVAFKEPIDSNITVSLTLGTQYSDPQGNKPEASYTLVFATGAKLDSGVISGFLDDVKPEGTFVYLYPLNAIKADTLNPANTKPKYRTQIGSNGKFEFQALAKGRYRIMAIRDESKDDVFNKGTDAVGMASDDINLADGSTATVALRVGTAEDIVAPKLFDVKPFTNNHLLVKFSEKIDTASVRAEAFMLTDSANTSTKIPIKAAHLSLTNPAFVDVYCAEPLKVGIRWKMTVGALKDAGGNVVPDSANTAYFNAATQADTVLPRLLRASLTDSTRDMSVKSRITFTFSGAVDTTFADSLFTFAPMVARTDVATVPFRIVRKAANMLVLEPLQPLVGNTWHRCSFSVMDLRSLNGTPLQDSLVNIHFLTEDPRGYGGVTGKLMDSSTNVGINANTNDSTGSGGKRGQYIVILESKDAPVKQIFRQILATPAAWEFADVPPGSYRLSAFYDANSNEQYDYGQPFPFRPAERFTVFLQDVVIRPRWTVENVSLSFP